MTTRNLASRRLNGLAYVVAIGAIAASPAFGASWVELETLTGQTDRGWLRSLDETRLVFETPTGDERQQATETLLRVAMRPPRRLTRLPASLSRPARGACRLRDGSRIVHGTWRFDGADRLVLAVPPLGPDAEVVLDPEQITAWRLDPPPVAANRPLDVLAETAAATRADVLLVRPREGDGEPVTVEGVLETIGPDGVRFRFGEQSGRVGWERIAGLSRYEPTPIGVPAAFGTRGCFVEAGAACRLFGEAVLVEPGRAVLFRNGEPTSLGLDRLTGLDYRPGRARFVDGLPLESSAGAVDVAGHGDSTEGAPAGGPLRLRFPDPRLAGAWRTRRFDRGVTLHAGAEATFVLPEDAGWLAGWAGVEPSVAATADAEVALLLDGRVAWSGRVTGDAAPTPLRLPTEGARRLTLRVDAGRNGDLGDRVVFAGLRAIP